jgi:hypothetical chaperone protein
VHIQDKLCSPADIAFLAKHDIMTLLKDSQRWAIDNDDAQKLNRLFVLVEDHLGYDVFKKIEETKVSLSSKESASFKYSYPEIEIEDDIPSSDFKFFTATIVDKIMFELDETLRRSGLKPSEIDIVCCTGGTAQIPAIQVALAQRFGSDKLREHRYFHSIINGLADKAQALMMGES